MHDVNLTTALLFPRGARQPVNSQQVTGTDRPMENSADNARNKNSD